MRLAVAAIAAPALCLAAMLSASAAPAAVAETTTKPAEIIIVGGKPAAARRTGVSPAATANLPARAAAQGMRSSAEMSMLELNSSVSKRSTELHTTTHVMSNMDDGQKKVMSNIGH